MLKFITKREYWEIEDSGILEPIRESGKLPWHLKTIQDAVAFHTLRPFSGQRIAEVGGGASRLLPVIAATNDCVNIEPFRGVGNGPTREVTVRGVTNIHAMVGQYAPILEPSSFDIVYSVSVVEHVPQPQLADFFRDCARILKAGGLMFHLIDSYLGDTPGFPKGTPKRLAIYRSALASESFEPFDPAQVLEEREPLFRTAYATNPDNVMQEWNRISPELRERRERTQSCSLLMMARRTSAAI
ncbi:MAG: methyltransferase domain-containing protein [Terrimicrobiaceae bacterium]|nr:methyltransferase domain-containing protein [Terrimicrobiaceae bacterium]